MFERASSDSDNRSLSRPIAVRWDGVETSLQTIGGAVQFLTCELQHLAATSEWRHAVYALGVAHENYTPPDVNLATRLVEHVYREATTLKRQWLAEQLVQAAADISD
jgi:hypothetical protein